MRLYPWSLRYYAYRKGIYTAATKKEPKGCVFAT
jgi:hypothetical protein